MDPFTLISAATTGASLLGGLFGSSGSKKAAKAQEAGIREGERRFQEQAARGEGFINQGADRGVGYMQPYVEGGRNGLRLYQDAIGVNGRDAQSAYHRDFQDDPGFQAALDAGSRQVEHSAIFRGRGDSGATQKELFAFGERERLGAFRDRLDRLSSLSSIGLQASKASGDYEVRRGNWLADIALKRAGVSRDTEMGIGAARAGGITGSTSAMMGAIKGIGSGFTIGSGSLDGGSALTSLFGKSGGKSTTSIFG